MYLHTQCFSKHEVDCLCRILHSKFNLECWQATNKHKPIIAISGRSFDTFLKLVKPHIIFSMIRKLPLPRK